jgi:WD40 repeat protein
MSADFSSTLDTDITTAHRENGTSTGPAETSILSGQLDNNPEPTLIADPSLHDDDTNPLILNGISEDSVMPRRTSELPAGSPSREVIHQSVEAAAPSVEPTSHMEDIEDSMSVDPPLEDMKAGQVNGDQPSLYEGSPVPATNGIGADTPDAREVAEQAHTLAEYDMNIPEDEPQADETPTNADEADPDVPPLEQSNEDVQEDPVMEVDEATSKSEEITSPPVPEEPPRIQVPQGPPPSVPNYRPRYIMSGHTRAISALKFSPDGAMLASCCEYRLHTGFE